MKSEDLEAMLNRLYRRKRDAVKAALHRTFPFGDYFTDRWERAQYEGFGAGSSVYDNVLVIGEVSLGERVWVGPNVILDGSGGLRIGDFCSISAGVQIYSHHTVAWALSLGREQTEHKPTRIGKGVYIGPNTIIQMGTTIGDHCVIGAMSLVTRDIPDFSKAYGAPARVVGRVDPRWVSPGA
ncbi:MAG: acyltransferase [Magnetococcales bacterium]|nr:acyltransferase [Magnetococcales bacterium]